jgi:hypothetical protein
MQLVTPLRATSAREYATGTNSGAPQWAHWNSFAKTSFDIGIRMRQIGHWPLSAFPLI